MGEPLRTEYPYVPCSIRCSRPMDGGQSPPQSGGHGVVGLLRGLTLGRIGQLPALIGFGAVVEAGGLGFGQQALHPVSLLLQADPGPFVLHRPSRSR